MKLKRKAQGKKNGNLFAHKKMVILLVLLVEISEINNQIFDHKHVRERGYNSGPGSVRINGLETCHSVGPINIHST